MLPILHFLIQAIPEMLLVQVTLEKIPELKNVRTIPKFQLGMPFIPTFVMALHHPHRPPNHYMALFYDLLKNDNDINY